MPTVNVIIPFRQCEYREPNLRWVVAYYRHRLPNAVVHVEEDHESDSPFNKSRLVNKAFRSLDAADVTIIADSDCFITDCALRMAIENFSGRLIIPHRHPCYTTSTQRDYVLGKIAPEERVGGRLFRRNRRRNGALGGIWAIDSELYMECPMDERFAGWGHEDLDFVESHPHVRFQGPLYHLWHPPASRQHVDRNASVLLGNRKQRREHAEQGLIYGR